MYRQNYPDDPGMHNSPRQPGHYGDSYVHGDSNTRVRYRRAPGFCERVRNDFVAIIAGLVLICVASGLLFWNEGRAVQTAKSLDEGLRQVRSLHNVDVIFDENNGKLIHIKGGIKTSAPLYDELYDIAISAVHLRRHVEMYQWVEEEHKSEIKEGDVVREEITYSYKQAWRSDLVRSSSFHNPYGHSNPESLSVSASTKTSNSVQVGSFYLSEGLKSQISTYTQLVAKSPPKSHGVHLYNGGYYVGRDPMYPVTGDIRVTFDYAGKDGEKVSVIGRQAGNEILSYQTDAGDALEVLYMGEMSAEKIFGKLQANNAMVTWALRFVGWLVMFFAFSCLTRIITTLVDWLPIVREVVTLGVNMMNVALAISLSLTIIAIGWIWYRPLLGMTILALAATPFIMARFSNTRNNQRMQGSANSRSSGSYYD